MSVNTVEDCKSEFFKNPDCSQKEVTYKLDAF